MPRVKMEVQARNSALVANLRGQDRYVRENVQRLNRRRGPNHYRRVYDRTPKDSWFMANHLRFEPSDQDFAYTLGWNAEDFTGAGKYPYYRVVLFGSSTVPGEDWFSPIAEDESQEYRRDLRAILQGGPMGRTRRSAA
jgi:hypothetical protein